MKKLFIVILLCLITATFAFADFLGFYDYGNESSDDSVWVYISMWDSLALKFESPDTLFIYRYTPGGDTLTADTITSLISLDYSSGFYMKRYRAGADIGQHTVHAYGSGNGNYYSLANHNYYVGRQPLDLQVDSVDIYNSVLSALMADSATVDTGAGSYAHYTMQAGSIPDSLLETATKTDSIYNWVGSPFQSWQTPTLHMKLGLGYDGSAGDGNIKDQLDTVKIYIGKHGQTMQHYTSLHDKLGYYSGMAGPGNNIKDDLAAVASPGGGTEPETLIAFSVEDSSRIQGARISVRSLDQSTLKVSGLVTDSNGKLLLALDPDSFWVEITANSFNQTLDTIIVTEGGGTDSLFMGRFDTGVPPEPGLCRVYGWVYDISGDSLSGVTITAEISREYHPVRYGNAVITPFSLSTLSDSSGYWQIDLIPSALLSDPEIKYMFTVKSNLGVIYRTKKIVPQFPGWELQ